MTILNVLHRTTYRYARPVTFGEHRRMMRPRDSHDLRLLETSLTLRPAATVRWLDDVFGNSVAIARFLEPARELCVESRFRAQHFPSPAMGGQVEEYARSYPFSYDPSEVPDLGQTTARGYPDPDGRVDAWVGGVLRRSADRSTLGILGAITRAAQSDLDYNPRDEMGTQDPATTLAKGGGTCRDFALLMREAARGLGFAARFVSGYLYDAALLSGGRGGLVGGGATHAWVQIYLPGAGWAPFDPTNGLIGDRNLIRVAVTRDPSQAIPLSGSFTGARGDFLGLTVGVEIHADANQTLTPSTGRA